MSDSNGVAIFYGDPSTITLVWLSDQNDADVALHEFDAAVGFSTPSQPFDEAIKDFICFAIPADKKEEWTTGGAFVTPSTDGLTRLR